MGFWGKIIGGAAGFALGGPPGLLVGAALGHAADSGGIKLPFGSDPLLSRGRVDALLGRREHLFAVNAVVLAAKLARCDGPVKRAEIDAFKLHFRIPPEAARDVGKELVVEAWSEPDRVVEAVRWTGPSYVFGVQWHPEFHDRGHASFIDDTPLLDDFLARARR